MAGQCILLKWHQNHPNEHTIFNIHITFDIQPFLLLLWLPFSTGHFALLLIVLSSASQRLFVLFLCTNFILLSMQYPTLKFMLINRGYSSVWFSATGFRVRVWKRIGERIIEPSLDEMMGHVHVREVIFFHFLVASELLRLPLFRLKWASRRRLLFRSQFMKNLDIFSDSETSFSTNHCRLRKGIRLFFKNILFPGLSNTSERKRWPNSLFPDFLSPSPFSVWFSSFSFWFVVSLPVRKSWSPKLKHQTMKKVQTLLRHKHRQTVLPIGVWQPKRTQSMGHLIPSPFILYHLNHLLQMWMQCGFRRPFLPINLRSGMSMWLFFTSPLRRLSWCLHWFGLEPPIRKSISSISHLLIFFLCTTRSSKNLLSQVPVTTSSFLILPIFLVYLVGVVDRRSLQRTFFHPVRSAKDQFLVRSQKPNSFSLPFTVPPLRGPSTVSLLIYRFLKIFSLFPSSFQRDLIGSL